MNDNTDRNDDPSTASPSQTGEDSENPGSTIDIGSSEENVRDVGSPIEPRERTVPDKINLDDANFRRRFALSLFWIFAIVVTSPILLIITALIIAFFLGSENSSAIFFERSSSLLSAYYPEMLGSVAGIFGTIIGFYFGLGSRHASNPSRHARKPNISEK